MMAARRNRFQEASVTVRDFIQKSKLISEGPPARYRLHTTRSNLAENGSVKKLTFGQRDNNMQNKILLMVGERRTGKTTLINAMVNYILGVKFTDEVWFEITQEGGEMSAQSTTQTTEITVYEVFAQDNPICLTIIDTPGYGDTRGTDVDKQIAENLYKLFHSNSGVKEIDAVCLVVNASAELLSDRQHYIFDAVLSLFGKDIENNIVIFITHLTGIPPKNLINALKKNWIPCRKDEENEPEHFLFNNQQAENSKMYKKHLRAAWELAESSLKDFFASLKEKNKKSLRQTDRVLTASKQLEACICNLRNCIDISECKSKELSQIQKALEKIRENIDRYENFTFAVRKYYKEKVPIENASWWDSYVTSCSVCEENCHEYGCWLAQSTQFCSVITNDHCTSCTGKCHYTKHVKENRKYARRSKEIIVTFDDLKKQYESSNNSASDIQFDLKAFENIKKGIESNKHHEDEKISIVMRLKEELTKFENEKAELVEEAYTTIIKLFEIALKPDSAFIIQCLDFLIPQAEETGRHVLAQKLRELRVFQPE